MKRDCSSLALALVLAGCGGTDDVAPSGDGGAGGGAAAAAGGEATSGAGSGGGGVPAGPPSLNRVGDTFDIATIAEAAPKRFVDVAYDPDNDGYLIVHGNAAIGGVFVDADGAPRAAPFVIAQTSAWTQAPRAAYGALEQAFLVAWHDTRDGGGSSSLLRGRMVRVGGGAASFLADDFPISGEPSYGEMPPGIAYSKTSQVFLVVWQKTEQADLRARRISPGGQLLGDEIAISGDPDWQSDAVVAWNPERDEFCVVHSHAGSTTSIRARRVAAATGELIGEPVDLTSAAGTWLPRIAWLPSTGGYLVGWYEGHLQGALLDAELSPEGASFPLFPGLGAYDGFAMSEVSATMGTLGVVMHGTNDEAWAGALGQDGEQSTAIEATSSPGDEGNFNPRIAAHPSRQEWLLVDARGFATVVGQRLGP